MMVIILSCSVSIIKLQGFYEGIIYQLPFNHIKGCPHYYYFSCIQIKIKTIISIVEQQRFLQDKLLESGVGLLDERTEISYGFLFA